jgi:hypothetical protein
LLDHFAERGIFAAHQRDIIDANFLKPQNERSIASWFGNQAGSGTEHNPVL